MSFSLKFLITMMKSKFKPIRKFAIQNAFVLHKNELTDEELSLLILSAAHPFPKSQEFWDDPSFVLLSYLQHNKFEHKLSEIKKHFDHFSNTAKYIVLEQLLQSEFPDSIDLSFELMLKYCGDPKIIFPLTEFGRFPEYEKEKVWILSNILLSNTEEFYPLLELEKTIKNNLMLDEVTERKLLKNIKGQIKELLLENNSYDNAYQTEFVYKHWGEEYRFLRTKIIIITSLLKFFKDEEVMSLLKQISTLKDPLIKSSAVVSLLFLKQNVSQNELTFCSEDIESRLYFKKQLERYHLSSRVSVPSKETSYYIESELIVQLLTFKIIQTIPNDVHIQKISNQQGNQFFCRFYDQDNEKWFVFISPLYDEKFTPKGTPIFEELSTYDTYSAQNNIAK